jgi:glycosyltransferase involved in cell wall biosynthesis
MSLPISLVAIVRNAGGRVKALIEKHRDVVSEVIIVDQMSTDGTYEEALQYADKVFRKRNKGTADPDRNWAFSLASQPYVLYLDDDEYLTDEAKQVLPHVLATDGDVFWLKRQNFVDGVSIEEIMGDDIQCRLFKCGAVRFPDEIHRYPEQAVNTKVFYLDVAIRHDRTFAQLVKSNKAREVIASKEDIEKQNSFISKVEALLKEKDGFSENWYSSSQLESLKDAVRRTLDLEGDTVEIGCWEGKSSCAIANEIAPKRLLAVDTWQGNLAEGEDHLSVVLAKKRDVFKAFQENVQKRTKGNVTTFKQDCFEFLKNFEGKVRFCHIDAAHDYDSVKRTIEALKPKLVKGAVLCGDDFMSANADRVDLNGGVERAVRECCPGFSSKENFWMWINN